ncbi:MAG: hypothetical protein OCC49_13115 [Fibrobacterales bacterium]
MQEIPEEYRHSLQKESIDDQIARVDELLANVKEPSAYNFGIKLALIMAKELKEGNAPGTQSGPFIKQLSTDFYPEFIEEIVGYAREFILKPEDLVAEIGKRLFNKEDSANE